MSMPVESVMLSVSILVLARQGPPSPVGPAGKFTVSYENASILGPT